LWRDNKLIKDLTLSLIEFNQLILDRFVLSLFVSSLINHPLISILRGLLKALLNLKNDSIVTSIKNIINYLKESRKFKTKYLIHRDLGEKNNLFVFDGKIYFFDFESCILTTSFFLVDIVSVSIFREKINSMESYEILDWDMIKMYLNNSDLYRVYDINSLKLQVWLILLRRALHLKQKDNILKKRLLDYLFENPFEESGAYHSPNRMFSSRAL
jgi:serine/threonine protein kinase